MHTSDLHLRNEASRSTFIRKCDHFLSYWFVHFELLLAWECGYVCHDFRMEKEGIYNSQPSFIVVIFHQFTVHFEHLSEWEYAYVYHNWRTNKEGINEIVGIVGIALNSRNKNQKIGVQVTFILKIKLQ